MHFKREIKKKIETKIQIYIGMNHKSIQSTKYQFYKCHNIILKTQYNGVCINDFAHRSAKTFRDIGALIPFYSVEKYQLRYPTDAKQSRGDIII